MTYTYKLVESPDGTYSGTIVNLDTTEIRVFDHKHPLSVLIVDLLSANELDSAFRSADVLEYVKENAHSVSEHIAYDDDGNVFYKDSQLPEGISTTMLNAISHGTNDGITALAKFIERVLESVTNTSRVALFSWIKNRSLTLTEDGCFIAYKGVKRDTHGKPVSIHSGPGYVNGEFYEHANLDNSIGNVLSINREYVEQQPGVSCGPGLHAGTWEYAESFSRSDVLAVKIKPEDVVSVPTDSGGQKLRVCGYEVLGVAVKKNESVLYPAN